mmetsp:Transcript_18711/g.47010  ORF Transcript_18711/g.47010 Transcript_18711/m.47010 type:complete len:201 (+) Transcript_18711:942-1544(+)
MGPVHHLHAPLLVRVGHVVLRQLAHRAVRSKRGGHSFPLAARRGGELVPLRGAQARGLSGRRGRSGSGTHHHGAGGPPRHAARMRGGRARPPGQGSRGECWTRRTACARASRASHGGLRRASAGRAGKRAEWARHIAGIGIWPDALLLVRDALRVEGQYAVARGEGGSGREPLCCGYAWQVCSVVYHGSMPVVLGAGLMA